MNAIAKYAPVIVSDESYSGPTLAGATCVLESGTTVKVYFTGSDSGCTINVSGAAAQVTSESGMVYRYDHGQQW